VVRRTPLGALEEVAAEVEPADAIAGDLVESWIHLEVDPVRDPAEFAALESELHQVLTDVRESVEDWPKMRAAALTIADELASEPRPPVPEKDISDSIALLRWLAADHFTFLGYREYELVEAPEPDESTGEPVTMLVAAPGTGLGILRNDQTRPRVLSSMSPEAYAKVFERRLPLVSRYRQRLAFVPLGQGRPCWVDDPHFNLRYHVRSTALASPGSERQLKDLAGRVFSQQLDRDKPLWEVWLVEGLDDDRFAVLSKTHHALVDGISGVDLATVMFDTTTRNPPHRSRKYS
jgi:hypothetical protein